MRSRIDANQLVRAQLSEICATAGVDQPRLVVDTSGPDLTVGLTGRPVLRYPMQCARTESPATIRGTVAHEVAHAVNGDTTAQPVWEMIKLFAKMAILFSPAFLAGEIAFFSSRRQGVTPAIASHIGWMTAGACVLTLIALLQIGLLRWPEFVQYDRPGQVRELRADLTAVQLVGPEPVLAFLEDMHRRERITIAGRRGLLRVRASGPRTHPETETRIAAVLSFDPANDPDAEATRLLRDTDPGR